MKTMKTMETIKYFTYQIMVSINEQDLMIIAFFMSYWV